MHSQGQPSANRLSRRKASETRRIFDPVAFQEHVDVYYLQSCARGPVGLLRARELKTGWGVAKASSPAMPLKCARINSRDALGDLCRTPCNSFAGPLWTGCPSDKAISRSSSCRQGICTTLLGCTVNYVALLPRGSADADSVADRRVRGIQTKLV